MAIRRGAFQSTGPSDNDLDLLFKQALGELGRVKISDTAWERLQEMIVAAAHRVPHSHTIALPLQMGANPFWNLSLRAMSPLV